MNTGMDFTFVEISASYLFLQLEKRIQRFNIGRHCLMQAGNLHKADEWIYGPTSYSTQKPTTISMCFSKLTIINIYKYLVHNGLKQLCIMPRTLLYLWVTLIVTTHNGAMQKRILLAKNWHTGRQQTICSSFVIWNTAPLFILQDRAEDTVLIWCPPLKRIPAHLSTHHRLSSVTSQTVSMD